MCTVYEYTWDVCVHVHVCGVVCGCMVYKCVYVCVMWCVYVWYMSVCVCVYVWCGVWVYGI